MEKVVIAGVEADLALAGERPKIDVDGQPVDLPEFYLMGPSIADVEDQVKQLSAKGFSLIVRGARPIHTVSVYVHAVDIYHLPVAAYKTVNGRTRVVTPSEALRAVEG